MRTGVIVEVSATDRKRLAAIVADRNAPQKHVWRAHIVLLTADGCGTAEIMRRTGTSKTAVWRWQERFMNDGVKGLLRDKTRPSRIPPLAGAVEQSVVARTLADPPGETTHWTAAAMGQESGISVSSVQRIWRRHGLRPHRVRQFKRSSCPTTSSSPASYGTLSGSMSIRRPTPSCCRSMKRARSRHWTALSQACP
jgi:transposase